MDYRKVSLEKHYEWNGKIEINARAKVNDKDSLSLAYTPGVYPASQSSKIASREAMKRYEPSEK